MTVVDATTLRRQVGSLQMHNIQLVLQYVLAERLRLTKHFCDEPVAHQVEPASPAFGGREQGASKARDDPVLGHRCFLARQHLGVVSALGLCSGSAINESYISYPLHSVPVC